MDTAATAEFTTNNAISLSIGFKPFYFNMGAHPPLPTSLLAGGSPQSTNEVVQVALERMKAALLEAETNLAHVQKRMAAIVNCLFVLV